MQFRKITMVGVGLLGGSIGIAARKNKIAEEIAGFVRSEKSVRDCEKSGATDFATTDLLASVSNSDLIILCTPLAQMASLAKQFLPALKRGAIVTDVGSVKAEVVRELESLVQKSGAHFIGSHPMAGAEKTGVAAARENLFENAVCVLTPTKKTNFAALKKLERFWKSLGARVLKMDAAQHDLFVSRTSHLPHVVAATLANLVLNPKNPKTQSQLCANGFRDTTRIASGSPQMWRDIALSNRKNLARSLDAFTSELQKFQHVLKKSDARAIAKFFEQAKSRRDNWRVKFSDFIGIKNEIESRKGAKAQRISQFSLRALRLCVRNKMPLPDLIEIVPLTEPVRAKITVPGSKSITNRALILAALADGEVTLRGALWSEDTQIMVECLRKLGFLVNVEPDPAEFCNRTITIFGEGGLIPNGGTETQPLEMFVGNAGTAARFLAALVCLGNGVFRLSGVPRMHERPQAALFSALRELGYRVECEFGNEKLPARIYAGENREAESFTQFTRRKSAPVVPKKCRVSIEESSQFASALLLCAKIGNWEIEIVGENAEESPYVAMTSKLIDKFPHGGGKFPIEPDASSGSYFWAAGYLLMTKRDSVREEWDGVRNLAVINWPQSDWQIDSNFADRFTKVSESSPYFEIAEKREDEKAFLQFQNRSKELLSEVVQLSRQSDLGDSIMTAITLAPLAVRQMRFTDLRRLRLQETERVVALRTELTKCGAKVIEEGDTLTVYPSQLHGAEIETYNDHRMAMCFAVLGLKVPGIKIINPACVKKTFPNFFQKFAAPQPRGLGATILDAHTGKKLEVEDLFVE